MVVKEGETENETVVQLTPKSENTYEINWNFSPIKTSGAHTLYLSAKITDEFDFQGTSTPLEILLTNNTELADKVPTWVPTALIILGSVVVVLLLLMVFMWRRMLSFAKQGGALLGKIAGEIRKTIVGGGKRGKPLASLKVLDGPPAMIGQELKIYTESVKMGRNPQLADMTFYGPDINTSVSGLHARLEKMSRSWRIVALSQSGSETFVDDQSIPFNEPVSLTSGQKIRMGYFAQQPVILEFSTEQAQSDSQYPKATPEDNDVRKTELLSNEMEDKAGPNVFFGRPNSMPPQSAAKKPTTQDSDSVFDDLRD
ncbi:MAG: FHA domain-containing protein [Saprospiraceae bacterium]|nr:FHA domain-containing protein [Saprospiraceae bacterium]